MSVKVFQSQNKETQTGIHLRKPGLVSSYYLTDDEATSLRDQLLKKFPLPQETATDGAQYKFPNQHEVKKGPRQWNKWIEVPADVTVEALGSNKDGEPGVHDRWIKRAAGYNQVRWVEGGSRLGVFNIIKRSPTDFLSGPYREVKKGPRQWDSWEEVPVGVKVEATGSESTNLSGTHDIWQKTTDGKVLVWWANGEEHNPPRETDTRPWEAKCGPFVEVPKSLAYQQAQHDLRALQQRIADCIRQHQDLQLELASAHKRLKEADE